MCSDCGEAEKVIVEYQKTHKDFRVGILNTADPDGMAQAAYVDVSVVPSLVIGDYPNHLVFEGLPGIRAYLENLTSPSVRGQDDVWIEESEVR
jgi:hypothetical protein